VEATILVVIPDAAQRRSGIGVFCSKFPTRIAGG